METPKTARKWEPGMCCPYVEVGYLMSRQTAIRWLRSAEEDLKTMEVRIWRRQSQD
jgi:hypothetical protein